MYKRSIEDERRLRKLRDESGGGYVFAGAYICGRGYLKRFTYGRKDLKKICTRKVRRKLKASDDLVQRNLYRKMSEYDWLCW